MDLEEEAIEVDVEDSLEVVVVVDQEEVAEVDLALSNITTDLKLYIFEIIDNMFRKIWMKMLA